MLLGVLLALAGCGGGSSEPITMTVVAGDLDGPLADDVLAALAEEGDASPPAVLIGNGGDTDEVAALRRVRQGVDQHRPVVLVGSDAGRIAELRRLVGLPEDPALAPDTGVILAYGVDTDDDGDRYDFVVTPVPSGGVVFVSGIEDDGQTLYETTREPDGFDGAASEAALARALLGWLHEDGDRSDDDVPAEVALVLADGGGSPLQNEMDKVVTSTERRQVFGYGRNVHSLSTTVWSAHSFADGEDWFYVRQKGQFAASSEIEWDSELDRWRYTYLYWTSTAVDGWQNNQAVFIDQSSPATVQNEAEVINRTRWNLEGAVGADLKDKGPAASASLSAGIKVDHTYTIKIPDVVVRNQSGTAVNNASWRFDIARPYYRYGLFCLGASGFGEMSPMSKSTFQPITDWIWRVSPQVRAAEPNGLPIRVDFQTALGKSTVGPWCLFREELEPSTSMSRVTTVPWPPLR